MSVCLYPAKSCNFMHRPNVFSQRRGTRGKQWKTRLFTVLAPIFLKRYGMVARCRSCCIHKETSRFLRWWLSVHTCFQIANWCLPRKKKNLYAVEVRSKFPKSQIIPLSTSTHGSIPANPGIFEFSERISQTNGLKKKTRQQAQR